MNLYYSCVQKPSIADLGCFNFDRPLYDGACLLARHHDTQFLYLLRKIWIVGDQTHFLEILIMPNFWSLLEQKAKSSFIDYKGDVRHETFITG